MIKRKKQSKAQYKHSQKCHCFRQKYLQIPTCRFKSIITRKGLKKKNKVVV